MSKYDEDIVEGEEAIQNMDEDDELDLVALVSSNANDTSQYLIFQGSDQHYYAKNVSKIEEILISKEITMIRNNSESSIIGTADVRGNMVTVINFDKWFGNEVLDESRYELIILAHYGGHRLGIEIPSVESIVNIPADTMSDNSESNDKTSFVTKIKVRQQEVMCMVFDSDKMLLDTFKTIDTKTMEDSKQISKVSNDKMVLFADDSRFIRKMAEELFSKMGLKYKMYENGQLLIDDLEKIAHNEIALFITDLEMPVLGGKGVIEYIRNDDGYSDINIIVHTNMSNDTMANSLIADGATQIIGKVNMLALSEAIQELMV